MTTYTVSNGQTLSGTTVFQGGTSVGTITLTTGDLLLVASGGTAVGVTVSGTATSVTTVSVAAGGTTSNLVISNGGKEVILGSATVIGTSVYSGGVVSDGGAQTGSVTGLYVASGGLLDITGATTSVTSPVKADAGAQIEFGGVLSSAVPTGSGTTTITDSSGAAAHEGITFASAYTYTSGQIGSGASARTSLTITCYTEGTNILTAVGERPIETIRPGDTVSVLRDGAIVQEAVKWVGHSKINLAHHARAEYAAPIRIKAGALGKNAPVRDLVLSPEHCLILDGRCIPVKLLINGASIAREFPAEPFTYYHIELEHHGILLAEGAEAESYLDTGNRSSFDNAETPRVLHPTFTVNANADLWKTAACAPLASVPDEVAPVWQDLAERAVELGMVIPTPVLVENPDLHLIVDGQRIQATSDRKSRHVFMVPAGAKSVTLASRFCIPADRMVPGVRDTRRLGVSVDWMAIRTTSTETILSADHPALNSGWNDVERDGAAMWRWTDGAATIPWENVDGSAVLTVRCTPVSHYPLYDEKLRLVA